MAWPRYFWVLPLAAQAQRGHEPTAVRNSSRSGDRDRRHRLDHRQQQGKERCHTLHMPPGLHPLGDDPDNAGTCRGLGLLDRPDLEKYRHAAAVRVRDVGSGVPPAEYQERDQYARPVHKTG
jgi:hypothetical protein